MITAHVSRLSKPVVRVLISISHKTEFVSVEVGQVMAQLVVLGQPQLVALI